MYATLSDLIAQYGLTEISQLLADEDGLVSASLLEAYVIGDTSTFDADEVGAINRAVARAESNLTQASRIIDSSVGARYPVPLTYEQAIATAVQPCCLALARASLADDGDNMGENTRKDRDHWREWLGKVATGRMIIPGLSPVASAGVTQRRLTAVPRSHVDWMDY